MLGAFDLRHQQRDALRRLLDERRQRLAGTGEFRSIDGGARVRWKLKFGKRVVEFDDNLRFTGTQVVRQMRLSGGPTVATVEVAVRGPTSGEVTVTSPTDADGNAVLTVRLDLPPAAKPPAAQ